MQPDPVADVNHPPLHFLVHAVPIDVACEVLHRGRSFVFELLGKGLLTRCLLYPPKADMAPFNYEYTP